MIVDATKSWTRSLRTERGLHLEAVDEALPAKAFVESMHKAFPESVSLVVLGDATISTPGITHHTNRQRLHFLLRSSWFYIGHRVIFDSRWTQQWRARCSSTLPTPQGRREPTTTVHR